MFLLAVSSKTRWSVHRNVAKGKGVPMLDDLVVTRDGVEVNWNAIKGLIVDTWEFGEFAKLGSCEPRRDE